MREKKQINIEIGEQIRAAREQARLTQEQLAEAIDVSVQFVSDLERGVVGVSLSRFASSVPRLAFPVISSFLAASPPINPPCLH